MRVSLRLAKQELASLFYSPIAWFILVIFTVQFGIAFTGKMEMYVSYKNLGYNTFNLTDYIFTSAQTPGLLLTVQSQLYLFIPLITMGLISREISSGSIKLLQSSPISVAEIVFGKYMGIMAYALLLIVLLLAYVFTASFFIPHFEMAWMMSGILGLFLLLAAYAAIGLFLSSLTAYQVVAALSTLAVLTFLHYIGSLWQDIDFVRHITYFLSVSGKADSMIAGLIRSKDLVYFIVVIALFLGLTMLKLLSGRESRSFAFQAARYTVLIAVCIGIGYISSLPNFTGYADVTSQKIRTLSPVSQEVVQRLKEPLEITTYVNLLDKDYNVGAKKQRNNDLARFEQYQRFHPELSMKYVYYYDSCDNKSLFGNKINAGLDLKSVAANVAESYKLNLDDFLPPKEIRKQIDLSGEGNRFVRIMKSGDRQTFLRLYNDFFKHPGEPNIVAAIKRLEEGASKIAFVSGNDLRSIKDNSDRGYRNSTSEKSQRHTLVNNGFEPVSVDLKKQEIPQGIQALVIADPRSSFSAEELAKIQAYINNGGNLLVTGEGEFQEYLQPIIAPLGLSFAKGTIAQTNDGMAANIVYSYYTAEAGILGEENKNKSTDSTFKVVMLGATALNYTPVAGFSSVPLLITHENKSWLKAKKIETDSLRIAFNAAEGDLQMPLQTAWALTREVNGKHQRIAVISDADFISNLELSTFRKTNGNKNTQFYNSIFHWFSNGQYPVTIPNKEPVDNVITLNPKGITWLKIFYLYALPAAIFIGGVLLLFYRRRK
ncbi:ABC transporter permease subunit [Pseudoflavitalea sp. G-6-1-2]|uniref:Gldg family protein n=1 Tax=Pseudoflavitalea sp. G-6-1-2 TaxID=2728841 RepID=UPI00146DA126|nr:Gldg family protein [Pseudoflavitalea sp. G-6-1-2]NML23853.1 ABC transporter permease subunit [Pseudoflavitalea sp. G-6-1-2]